MKPVEAIGLSPDDTTSLANQSGIVIMTEDISSASGSAASEPVSISTTSMEEFEAELARRTKVPAPTIDELMKTDDATIRREADAVSKILKRFASAVVDSMDDSQGFDRFLRELDLKAISRDHNWRTIFYELRNLDGRFEQHKCVLVIKYLQYLSFRKKLLDYIHERKLGLVETNQHPDLTIFPEPGDPARRDGAAQPIGEFARVPLGESVTFDLPTTGSVPIMLSRRMFRLLGQDHPYLVDPNGKTHVLKEGRNMLGRHPESDVVIDRDFNDVSRAHAILDWHGGSKISITDLSTRGTFVPVEIISGNPEGILGT